MTASSIDKRISRTWVAIDDPRWRQAHAPSILAVGDRILAAWFAGTREGTPDNRIWFAARDAAGGSWSSPEVLASGDHAHWNPVLAHGPEGDVWLFYKVGAQISRWRTLVRRSGDAGRTWTAPEELVPGDEGGRGPVKNPPLLLPSGVWLAPASTESWGTPTRWDCYVDRSVDGGRSWQLVEIPLDRTRLTGAGAIQPALWSADGVAHALARTTEGVAFISQSSDEGRTWSRFVPTTLPNNNSGLSVAHADGLVICAHNPVSGDWGLRCPLALSVSRDGGVSWEQRVVIDDGVTPVDGSPERRPSLPRSGAFAPADTGVLTDGVGEYSYPSAVVRGDEVLVVYSWQRRGIVEARVPLGVLRG